MTAELDLPGVLDGFVQAGAQKLGSLLGSQVTFAAGTEGSLPDDLPPTYAVSRLHGEPTRLVLVQEATTQTTDADLLPTLVGAIGRFGGAEEPETVEGTPSVDPDDQVVVWDGAIGEVPSRLYWIIPPACAHALTVNRGASPADLPGQEGLGRRAPANPRPTQEQGLRSVNPPGYLAEGR